MGATSTTFFTNHYDSLYNFRSCNVSTTANMAIVPRTANENPDVENVQKNITRRNVTVQLSNASIARAHMKHGVMSVLHGLQRNIDLKNCEIARLTSSLSNFLFLFPLLGLGHPRILQSTK